MEDELTNRRVIAESTFADLTKQKQQKEAELREIDTELVRLQGEYRLIDDLLNKKAEPSVVSPEPETIDVDNAVEEKS